MKMKNACAGEEQGLYWQRPWRLKAEVVYGWRAHRQQLSRLTAHPSELLVATAGRGNVAGQELDVVRCWNLAYAAAGTQLFALQTVSSCCQWPVD